MILELDDGQGIKGLRLDWGEPNVDGDFDEHVYGGNLYLTIDGQLYGSVYIRLDRASGQHVIALGQLDPQTYVWEARNEIGPEVSIDDAEDGREAPRGA